MTNSEAVLKILEVCNKDVVLVREKRLVPYYIIFTTENHAPELEKYLKAEYIQLQQYVSIENFDFNFLESEFSKNAYLAQKFTLLNRISGNGEVRGLIFKLVNKH